MQEAQPAENIHFALTLETPILGDTSSSNGTYLLDYDVAEGTFSPRYALWKWAITQAATALHWTINTDYLRFPVKIKTQAPRIYKRVVDKRNPSRTTLHESLPKGAVLPVSILLLGTLPPGRQIVRDNRPSAAELETIMQLVGEQIGISPWGSKFGYGRFTTKLK